MRRIVAANAVLLVVAAFFLRPSEASADQVPTTSPEFCNDVMPVLSKAGCNLGTCHGNLNGKGGLKLSLRGQDPEIDFRTLVRAAKGRRVNLAAPELSLLIQKAAGVVAHGGGIRLPVDSESYRLVVDWLSHGAQGPSSEAARLIDLDVQPQQAIVSDPDAELQVEVTATFSDGTRREVTAVACYELSNLNAEVDVNGRVSRKKFGETTLIVRFLHEQRAVPIAFIESRPDFQWSDPEPWNEIDLHVFAKLQRLRVNPSPVCDDSTFVRRAYLDAIGKLPSADEAREFVEDHRSDKRDRLIDELLVRPEFADYWALKWADVLRVEEKVLDTRGVEVFHGWIRQNISQGLPLDQFVRELVTGMGQTFEQPAANFYRANRDAVTRGETTARLFLGTRLQCAKCHNHPFDRWTQDDYYRWSSLFSQIKYEGGDGKRQDDLDKNEVAGDQTVVYSKSDEVLNPTTLQVAAPKFLGGDELSAERLAIEAQTGSVSQSRLQEMADWLTSPSNELFVQSQANFIWYQLMGLGIVDPIDDFRLTNPPSNPALLQSLADTLLASHFDLRSLVGKIMKSRTYQLSSAPNESNRNDTISYSHAAIGRLPAEVVLDMQSDFLGLPAKFLGQPSGIRAVQIPGVISKQVRRESPADGDRFMKTFGKPDRILACDCERSNETTLKQAFVLIGDGLNDRINSPHNRISALAMSGKSDEAVIDELYWTALSRPPSEMEKYAAMAMIDSSQSERVASFKELFLSIIKNPTNNDRVYAIQDLSWALLNAKEFLFRN